METSRERVRKTLNHVQPEGLAIDFGSSGSTGLSVFSYDRLKKALGINPAERTSIYDLWLMQAAPSMEMIDRFGGDLLQVPHRAPAFGIPLTPCKTMTLRGVEFDVPEAFCPRVAANGDLTIEQNGVTVGKMPVGGYFFDMTAHPCEDIEEVSEINDLVISPMPEADIDHLAREARRLYETTDKSLMYYYPRKIFEDGISNWGFENFLCALLSNEEMVHRYFERLTDVYLQDLERILSRISPFIDMIRFVDDLGTQDSTLISPQTYRALIKPYHERLFRFIRRKYPSVKVALHSCGAIRPLIPDLIDIGVQVLNPVQISASGMDPASLKAEFGEDLVFWGGGANMQFTAENESAQVLAREVECLIRTFAPGGGYLFSQVHAIQANVPPEKICAIFDTALKFR